MIKIKDFIYIAGAVLAIGFWFFTIYGLPPRVERLENNVSALEKKLISDEVKLNMILESVTRMESFILNHHGNGN